MPPTVTTAPSPVQTGIASNFIAWYQMTVSDTCNSIAAMFGTFSSAGFINWNPGVWSDCLNIKVSCLIEALFIDTLADLQTFLGALLLLCCSPRHTHNTHDQDATNDNHIDNFCLRSFGCRKNVAASLRIQVSSSRNSSTSHIKSWRNNADCGLCF
jgi:fucose permease